MLNKSFCENNNVWKYLPLLLLCSCSLAFSPGLFDSSNIIRFVLLSFLLVMFFILLLIKKKTLVFPNHIIFYCYLFFVFIYGLTSIYAINIAEATFDLSKRLLAVFCCIIFYNFLNIKFLSTLKLFGLAATLISIILIITAMVQFFQMENHSFFFNPEIYSIKGLNVHKNLFSSMLFLLSPFLLSTYFLSIKNKRNLFFSLFVVCILLLLLLQTRATLFGIIITILFWGVLFFVHKIHIKKKISQKKYIYISTVFTICILFFFFSPLKQIAKNNIPLSGSNMSILRTASLNERFSLWKKTYEMIEDAPLLGCGIGNWKINYPKTTLNGLFRADYLNHYYFRPHNDFLLILSEGGWFVFTIYIAFICFLIIFSFYKIIGIQNKRYFCLFSIFLSFFVGFQFISFFDYPSERIELLIWSNIIIAVLFVLILPANNQENKKTQTFIHFCCILIFTATSLVGIYRFRGERLVSYMQRFINENNWKQIEKYSIMANSFFYNFTPTGFPIYFYHGQACSRQGVKATQSFRKALSVAPFHKQSLNELGKCEFFNENNQNKATLLFEEAIRISPNYAYPYFNLTHIYLINRNLSLAKNTINRINLDKKQQVIISNANQFNLSNFWINEYIGQVNFEKKIKNELISNFFLIEKNKKLN